MANKNRTGTAIRNFMMFYENTILIETIDNKTGETKRTSTKTSFKLSETVRVRRGGKNNK